MNRPLITSTDDQKSHSLFRCSSQPPPIARTKSAEAARKNGKTGLAAELAAIIERVPFLDERLSLRRHAKEIENIRDKSVYAALLADVPGKHSLSPSFVVYDQLGQAPKRDLFDALDAAMGARAEPLMLVISTQAAEDLAPMSELIDYGLWVNAEEIEDPSFHLTPYAAPEDADPWSPPTWELANPALGDFRSLEGVARQAAQAQRIPSKEAAFKNLIVNMRVAAGTKFLPLSEWKACGAPVRALTWTANLPSWPSTWRPHET